MRGQSFLSILQGVRSFSYNSVESQQRRKETLRLAVQDYEKSINEAINAVRKLVRKVNVTLSTKAKKIIQAPGGPESWLEQEQEPLGPNLGFHHIQRNKCNQIIEDKAACELLRLQRWNPGLRKQLSSNILNRSLQLFSTFSSDGVFECVIDLAIQNDQ